MKQRPDLIKMFIIDFNFVVFDEDPALRPTSTASDYADVNAREVFDYALSLGNNAVFCHAFTINGCATYPTRLGPVSAGSMGNLLPELYRMTRERGLPFWSYFDVGQDGTICSSRPHWLIPGTGGGGNPPGFLAPETGWTDLFCARVEEFLSTYKVDWLLFDGFVYGSFHTDLFQVQPAWYMEKPFREIFGRAMPAKAEDISPDENLLYKREILARQFRRIRDVVRKTSPATKICFNVPFWKPAEPIWVDHPMVNESDGLIAETTNEALVEYLLGIRKPGQRLFLTVINCLDGFRFDTTTWQKWHDRGCDFHGYAWGTPPDWRPAARFRTAVEGFRRVFTGL
jgi:hypothetical protein